MIDKVIEEMLNKNEKAIADWIGMPAEADNT
jgi:hypothetical protein